MALTEKQMADRLAMIKKAAKKVSTGTTVQAKRVKKEHSRLTKSVKKAGHQSPSSLDAFSEKNMYYSDRELKTYLGGTSYIDTYNSMKSSDEWN